MRCAVASRSPSPRAAGPDPSTGASGPAGCASEMTMHHGGHDEGEEDRDPSGHRGHGEHREENGTDEGIDPFLDRSVSSLARPSSSPPASLLPLSSVPSVSPW